MHHFLNSVGFKNLKKQEDLDQLLQSIVSSPTSHMVAVDSEGNEYAEFVKEFGDSMGIMVRGRFMADDTFRIDYYVPYLRGEGVTSEEQIEIQKHSEKESYAGICDEVRLGVSLIFYLQNTAEYLNERNIFPITKGRENVTLAGLSVNGKIILSVNKNEKQKKNIKKSTQNRNHLIAAAREGDEEAIESLTLEDMDTYSMLSRRIAYEDILTIVDTCFMPYGIESDQYSVIGEILDYRITKNEQSKEEVYIMKIDTNGLVYDICINKEDLLGEPEIGRRFKGSIWMQGRINYVN